MTTLEILENKIRNAIPELKEEFGVFQEGILDKISPKLITQIMLNHVLEWLDDDFAIDGEGDFLKAYDSPPYIFYIQWNLKSAYLKDQSEELINFLNELK